MAFAMLIGLLPVTALAAEGSAASINGAEYATLAEAFAAVKDEAVTVTLLRDTEVPSPITIAEGKTVTLDMQGHKISVSNDFSGRVFVNNGTFTIQGNGTIDVTAAGQNGYGSVNNFGTLTVSGGPTQIRKHPMPATSITEAEAPPHLKMLPFMAAAVVLSPQ